jgi:hypothetical protein
MRNLKILGVLTLALVLCLLPVAGQATIVMYDNQADWAAAVGGNFAYVDIPFTAISTVVAGTAISLPAGGSVSFDIDTQCRQVPSSWATWSGGNTPKVLYTNGANAMTGTFTVPQKAFGLEMEPNDSTQNLTMTITLDGTLTQSIYWDSGAKFFGWVSDVGYSSMQLTDDGPYDTGYQDFAIGRLVQPVPIPASAMLLGSGLMGLGLLGWRRKSS